MYLGLATGSPQSRGLEIMGNGRVRLSGWDAPGAGGGTVGMDADQYRPGLIEGCLAGTGLALDQIEHSTDITN